MIVDQLFATSSQMLGPAGLKKSKENELKVV